MLVAYNNNIGWVSDADNSLWSLILIALIMACELGPIFVAMDYSVRAPAVPRCRCCAEARLLCKREEGASFCG
jgi:hypothetical protein